MLAIARAVVAVRLHLFPDEATSSIDTRVRKDCTGRSMDKLMKGRTTFVIAHRSSTKKFRLYYCSGAWQNYRKGHTHEQLIEQNG